MPRENVMDSIQELRAILFEFVKRAASKGATPEEVEALPRAAMVLLETFTRFQ